MDCCVDGGIVTKLGGNGSWNIEFGSVDEGRCIFDEDGLCVP